MPGLREELVESQKIRSDLLKWKLIVASALGATGLGLGKEGDGPALVILALVPLACFYVDLQCRHMTLRMRVIGTFLGRQPGSDGLYERFVGKARTMGAGEDIDAFALEDWALGGSTKVLSALVTLVGLAALVGGASSQVAILQIPWMAVVGALVASGLVGLFLTAALGDRYSKRSDLIKGLWEANPDLLRELQSTPPSSPASRGG